MSFSFSNLSKPEHSEFVRRAIARLQSDSRMVGVEADLRRQLLMVQTPYEARDRRYPEQRLSSISEMIVEVVETCEHANERETFSEFWERRLRARALLRELAKELEADQWLKWSLECDLSEEVFDSVTDHQTDDGCEPTIDPELAVHVAEAVWNALHSDRGLVNLLRNRSDELTELTGAPYIARRTKFSSRTHFMRAFGASLHELCRTPMYATVATITNVIFEHEGAPTALEATVRDSIRSRPRRPL